MSESQTHIWLDLTDDEPPFLTEVRRRLTIIHDSPVELAEDLDSRFGDGQAEYHHESDSPVDEVFTIPAPLTVQVHDGLTEYSNPQADAPQTGINDNPNPTAGSRPKRKRSHISNASFISVPSLDAYTEPSIDDSALEVESSSSSSPSSGSSTLSRGPPRKKHRVSPATLRPVNIRPAPFERALASPHAPKHARSPSPSTSPDEAQPRWIQERLRVWEEVQAQLRRAVAAEEPEQAVSSSRVADPYGYTSTDIPSDIAEDGSAPQTSSCSDETWGGFSPEIKSEPDLDEDEGVNGDDEMSDISSSSDYIIMSPELGSESPSSDSDSSLSSLSSLSSSSLSSSSLSSDSDTLSYLSSSSDEGYGHDDDDDEGHDNGDAPRGSPLAM